MGIRRFKPPFDVVEVGSWSDSSDSDGWGFDFFFALGFGCSVDFLLELDDPVFDY